MTTATLTQKSAIAALYDARQQHELVSKQFSELQSQLRESDPGSDEFTGLATRAASLKGKLQNLTSEIRELEPLAKTEKQRQQEAQEAAALAAAELEAQSTIDLDQAETLLKTINAASDTLALAIAELASLDGWPRLGQTGKLRLDMLNRRPKTIAENLPYVSRQGGVARLQKRTEAGLR